TTKDRYGHINTIFIHGKDIWFLKEEFINPYETIGVGIKDTLDPQKLPIIRPSFGFRPLTRRMMLEIMNAYEDKDRRSLEDIINRVLNADPRPLSDIRTPLIVEGPILHMQTIPSILNKQEELDTKLRIELNNLLSRRYPHLTTMYY
ncbi:MAG: hypothetical protein N3F06_04920, partial [Nitrososphaerales archaeon]|nr:hypothetical protein [Nitrososphaerales archaeon]